MYPTAALPHRILSTVGVSLVLVAGGATTASARPDPGESRVIPVETSSHHCLLERVGTQYVRCDDLTGNGVPAPVWVPGS